MDTERFRVAVEQAKLDALKEFAYGASHEINNPLANIAARAQSLLRDEADERRRKALEAIHRSAMRAHEMISDLMLFARPPALARETVDVGELVSRVLDDLRSFAEERAVALTATPPGEPLGAWVDGTQLAAALKAVVENGIEAIGSGGEVAVASRRVGELLEIEVRDTGPGVSPEARRHLFDPFYSGREAGRGLGFGLPKCWRVVTDHGGTITVDSPPAQGAVFLISLPVGGATG